MNIYDFDKTIYDGDSTIDFYLFLVKRHPSLLKYLPRQGFAFAKYIFGFINKTRFKEIFYCFLNGIKDIDSEVDRFWSANEHKIKQWYIEKKQKNDLVISASPEFLLAPVCSKLGIELMASRVDKHTGKTEGENCYGEEKVLRLKEKCDTARVEQFYSDSLSDAPLADIADEAFIVAGDNLILWNEYKLPAGKKFIKTFFSKEFLGFLCIGVINTINGILFSMLYSCLIDNINISFNLGYITALTISYLLNGCFVFKDKLSIKGFLKFAVSYIPNYLVQNVCVAVFGNIIMLPDILVYTLSAVIGVPVTFILLKFFAFKKRA